MLDVALPMNRASPFQIKAEREAVPKCLATRVRMWPLNDREPGILGAGDCSKDSRLVLGIGQNAIRQGLTLAVGH